MRAKEFISESDTDDKIDKPKQTQQPELPFGKGPGIPLDQHNMTEPKKIEPFDPLNAIAQLPVPASSGASGKNTGPAPNLGPAVKNVVVPPPKQGGLLNGRVPAKPEDVTHGYRNMHPAELQGAQSSGYFEKNPNPSPRIDWPADNKYWASGDAQGHFGRDWKNKEDNVRVRVPVGMIPDETAVDVNHAEIYNKNTGEWMPAANFK
jgi:hypothetical protein